MAANAGWFNSRAQTEKPISNSVRDKISTTTANPGDLPSSGRPASPPVGDTAVTFGPLLGLGLPFPRRAQLWIWVTECRALVSVNPSSSRSAAEACVHRPVWQAG
jgi:hypothetical protein